ncbi:hypothetical protein [Paraburkholderia youngii]|uniref:hypothetical protein n=1 Tax=Paraburkholderia youngii TaxID=2782701 RepID=UPI003D1EB681
MMGYLSERENVVSQIDAICLRLFDAWCETRSLTALAYLMHCWPLSDSSPSALRRLGETLRDLRRNHANRIDDCDFRALCEVADLIDELAAPRRVTLTARAE